jgi:hypothetical protein
MAIPVQIRTVPGFKASATCVNCRESHLKCTGGTTCTRCAYAGKICYYVSSRRGQRKTIHGLHVVSRQSNSDSSSFRGVDGEALIAAQSEGTKRIGSSRHSITRQPPSVGAPEEQKALVFYCEDMMPILIAANTATSRFWGRLVPQASQSEPAIRHMLVAVSSWQEMIKISQSNREKSFHLATKHHTKALAVLTQPGHQPSVVVTLIACLLMILREGTEDPVGEMSDVWIQHALSGLRILREWRLNYTADKGLERDTIIDEIEPVFMQIQVVMSMFLPTSLATIRLPGQTRPQLPKHFTGHIQMRDTFCEIHRWRYHKTTDKPHEWVSSSPHFKDVHTLLKDYHLLLLVYLSDKSISFLERRVGAVLWSQCRMMEASLSFSVRTDVADMESICPLIVDLSQPGRTVVVHTRTASTTKFSETYSLSQDSMIDSLLRTSRRPYTASNHEPTGLWPIREVWHSAGPLEVIFVGLFAPASIDIDHDESRGVPDDLATVIDADLSKDAKIEQHNHANSFEFIDIRDPNARTKARSHLTRQQRRR